MLLLLPLMFVRYEHGEYGDTDGNAKTEGHNQRMGHDILAGALFFL